MIIPKNVIEVNPLHTAWNHMGKKFDWLILEQFFANGKKRRFNELLVVPGLTPSILSNRLKSFEKSGLVSKSIIMGQPIKTEYHLTDKSEKLALILDLLKEFGRR